MPNAIVNVGKWYSNKETLWGMIKVCNELGFKDFNTILLVNFILFPLHNYKTLFFSCSFDIRLLPKDAITKLTNTDLLCVKNTAQKQKPASPLEDIHGKSGVILLCLFKSVHKHRISEFSHINYRRPPLNSDIILLNTCSKLECLSGHNAMARIEIP